MTADRVRRRAIARRLVQVTVIFGGMGGVLFVAAGRLDYTGAWLWTGGNFAMLLVLGAMLRGHGEVVAERARLDDDAKPWDRRLVRWYSLTIMALLVVAGLDAGRFGWSPRLPYWTQLAGLALGVAATLWVGLAMRANRFFANLVRVQRERGHTVCDQGPYAVVRHPGYLGFALVWLASPLVLASLWAFIPAVVSVGLLVLRTALEDATLQAELEGYADYTTRVRARLLPGVW